MNFSLFNTTVISTSDFFICILASLLIGLFLAGIYSFRTKYTQSFFTTIVLLPAIVCVIIMLVNGNIGTGIAVAGTFSLVRFRSVPGSAKEIGAIFLAMGAGLLTGMGYIGFAAIFAIIMGIATILLNIFHIGAHCKTEGLSLRITIPEDLNYTDAFSDLFETYTTNASLIAVKTTNMGSMFRLTYSISFKKNVNQKDFIDALRCRNGNLEISLFNEATTITEL